MKTFPNLVFTLRARGLAGANALAAVGALALTGCVGEIGDDGSLTGVEPALEPEAVAAGPSAQPGPIEPSPPPLPQETPVVPMAPEVPVAPVAVAPVAVVPVVEPGELPAEPSSPVNPTPVNPPGLALTGFYFDGGSENFRIVWHEPNGWFQGPKVVDWFTADGFPTPGTLSVTIPFNAPSQKVHVANNSLDSLAALDATGKILSAQVNVYRGLTTDPNNPGGAKLYAKSGEGFVFAAGEWVNLETGVWTSVELLADNPAYVEAGGSFDPTQIVEIGVEIATGSLGAEYSQATVLIDSVTWQ